MRSLICVYVAVTRQITELSERLTTDVTAVRSLICVCGGDASECRAE